MAKRTKKANVFELQAARNTLARLESERAKMAADAEYTPADVNIVDREIVSTRELVARLEHAV